MGRKRKLEIEEKPVVIQWLAHEFGPTKPRIRVRLSSWANDAFEVVSWDDFHNFKALAEKLLPSIRFEELD